MKLSVILATTAALALGSGVALADQLGKDWMSKEDHAGPGL